MPHLQVGRRFQQFIQRLQPRLADVRRARSHFLQVRACIAKGFAVSKIVPAGSHAKGTAVQGISDVDVFTVLRRDEARWGRTFESSSTVLRRVRDQLVGRYPTTSIRRDEQAVVIAFRRGENPVDVVPAFFYRAAPNGYPLYLIPDGTGDWLTTSPDIHAAYLSDSDARTRGKLKRVVQMVKFWAKWRGTPLGLSSFHTEVVFASHSVAAGVMPYSEAVCDALATLRLRQGAALRDPCGVSGLIPATGTETQRTTLSTALEFAHYHASAAVDAESDGNWREAVRQWRIVFGEFFPA